MQLLERPLHRVDALQRVRTAPVALDEQLEQVVRQAAHLVDGRPLTGPLALRILG